MLTQKTFELSEFLVDRLGVSDLGRARELLKADEAVSEAALADLSDAASSTLNDDNGD